MLNALVSLCDKRANDQDALYQLGYKARDIRFEYPTGITGGKGVVVDLLLLSAEINSVLCVECKSGQNVELAQARGYRKVRPQQFAPLVSKWRELSAFSVDVVYVCTAVHLERISKGLKRENLDHSILCFHQPSGEQLSALLDQYPHLRAALTAASRPCLITLERNKIKNPRLASRLSRGVALDLATVPLFLRFDVSSSMATIARCLLHALAELAAQSSTSFSSEELASAAYGVVAWQKTMRHAELLYRVNDALTAAADDPSLRRYLTREPEPTPHPAKLKWRVSTELVGAEAASPFALEFAEAVRGFIAELARTTDPSANGL